jgi:signal transduction histidine kinase
VSYTVSVAGCVLAAVAAFLPLRRPAFAVAVAVAFLLWVAAAAAGGLDAVRPLAAACVLLLTWLVRWLLQDRRRAELLLATERALHAVAERSAATAERERIARDLHDGLTHLLTGQLLVLRTAVAALADGDTEAAAVRVGQGVELSRRALAEARDVVRVLAGAGPDLALVRDTVSTWEAATGRTVAVHLPAALPPLGGPAWVAVLATLREALTNAARHAPGADVQVRLTCVEDGLRLVVEDEPVPGATPASLPNGAGTGLQGLRERAALAAGELVAGPLSSGRRGWRVALTVPAGAARPPGPA